ncbi:hypothetical protein LPJ61_000923 [Coemansia biformis]|uniref:Uncharacterized protein n=1 Tax=Coemansia biformis TaxID=1286918 RepID=A0A9W7YIQ0_9FUNG|nr:hypothetical protein LPJ61_000923 [Coemansia biformis]
MIALAAASRAAPLPRVERRQADLAPSDGYGWPDLAGNDAALEPGAAASWDTYDGGAVDEAPVGEAWPDTAAQPDDSAPEYTIANLAGNSLTQVDNGVSVNDIDVEYPGDSELTGNTGTAVSGNGNDIMPIINAPVTVIVNSGESGTRHRLPPPLGSSAAAAPGAALGTWPLPGSAAGGLQRPVPPYVTGSDPWATDPFSDRIQQLVAYALAASQSHM